MKRIIFLFIAVTFLSCKSNNPITITPLPTEATEKELIRKFDIDNLSFISDVQLVDSLLVIIYYENDYLFHVYNINSGELVSKFGSKGRQVNEFLSSDILADYKHSSNNFVVYDSGSSYFKRIQLSDIVENQSSQDRISNIKKIPENFSAHNLSASNDLKVIVGTAFSRLGKEELENRILLYTKDSVQKIESPFFKMFRYPATNCLTIAESNDFTVNYDKEIIAAGYYLYDAILLYDFNGNVKKSIYLSEPKSISFNADQSYLPSEDAPMYFFRMVKSDDFIFALRYNLPTNVLNKYFAGDREGVDDQPKTQILKVNWDGEITAMYQFEGIVPLFCVDDKGEKIVTLTKHPTDSEKFKIEIYAI